MQEVEGPLPRQRGARLVPSPIAEAIEGMSGVRIDEDRDALRLELKFPNFFLPSAFFTAPSAP